MNMITAVVVTYNRLGLLTRCVEHLRSQTRRLDNIIVVNNGSTDGTREWLDGQADLEVIHQENVGGSGGFYRGIQYAHEKGYDWIWCMDDDVYPEPDCLEALLGQDDDGVGMLVPLRKQDGEVFVSETKTFNMSNPFRSMHRFLTVEDVADVAYLPIEGIAFEGPLIKRSVVDTIGLPNKDLYLLYDDSDYSYRAVLAGFGVRLVTSAILNKEQNHIYDNSIKYIKQRKWKFYYYIRNYVYFNQQYGQNVFVRRLRPIGRWLRHEAYVARNILVNDKYTLSDARQFWCGYWDGVRGRLGKREF